MNHVGVSRGGELEARWKEETKLGKFCGHQFGKIHRLNLNGWLYVLMEF